MTTIYWHECHRCGHKTARAHKRSEGYHPGDRKVYCGICEIHLETGIIGPGLRPARDGFVLPRWAKKY